MSAYYSETSVIRTNIFGPLGQKQTFSWPKGPAHALGRPLAALRTLAGPFGPARWLFLAQRAKNISPDYRVFTVYIKNVCKNPISSEMIGPGNGASVYMYIDLSDILSEALPRTELSIPNNTDIFNNSQGGTL